MLFASLLFTAIGKASPDSHFAFLHFLSMGMVLIPVRVFSNEYSGLISFRMDWLDLLAVQVTLKSLLQHRSSKASIPEDSVFFIVQLSPVRDYWKNPSFDWTDLC